MRDEETEWIEVKIEQVKKIKIHCIISLLPALIKFKIQNLSQEEAKNNSKNAEENEHVINLYDFV